MGDLPNLRKILNELSFRDGILHGIERLNRDIFPAMRSWVDADKNDHNVLLLRFEDLIKPDNFGLFKRLFSHLEIKMPDSILSTRYMKIKKLFVKFCSKLKYKY